MAVKYPAVADYASETLAPPVTWQQSSRTYSNLLQRLSIGLCVGVGLAAIAFADEASRRGWTYRTASVPFWLGLLLIFVPLAFRALSAGVHRRERLALVVILGIAFYLVKVIASPHGFTFVDEYIHVRNTQDILRTHHLFAFNPLLPTAAYYPGLGALTAGVVELTGLSIFTVGLAIIGVARVLFCICLYLVAEKVTGSDRAAVGASLIYAANPMFLFWSASFSYENLALPLAAFVVWWVARTRSRSGTMPVIAASIGVVAVTITHHVVGFALSALLTFWWFTERLDRLSVKAQRRTVGLLALLAGVTTLVWFLVVAQPAARYLLSDNLTPALRQTWSLLLGHIAPRKLYASGGLQSPSWEVAAGFAAIIVLLFAVPPALRRAWRSSPVAMGGAVIVAVAYPLTLVPRLAPEGVAISGRSSEYVFLGLGCVVGLLVTEPAYGRVARRLRRVRWAKNRNLQMRTTVATVLAAVVLVGNVTIGTAFYERLPEATHPRGDPWSVQPDVITASKWARTHLGINRRFGANALDSYALATYGEQETLEGNRLWSIFFARSMSPAVAERISAEGLRYLLVNWRMTRGVPPTPGYYFSPEEPGAGQYRNSFPKAGLEKFFTATCARLIYQIEAVQIFDVSQIGRRTCESSPGHKVGSE
jgi:hypothetical protein